MMKNNKNGALRLMRSFNRFIGQSTFDPSVKQAFQDGRIEELLTEYGFTQHLRKTLLRLEAETFEEFTLLAYGVLNETYMNDAHDDFPWPADGLRKNGKCEGKRQVA